ncbi:cation:dicarboxylate symporter family transporter [Streptomyces purpurascens]|uniref:cation:dicarboxylate symporter family transporter n=1 Tax=Streptomyces purpurascens TaxID=1924 RepID=UPI001996C0BD|nr:cation:dicarboxylase symporter family transporter [Streptomyces purpurascens]MCE7049945.1 cation:dicarboxylase symporter family transporter [Streptomyces purpurascens]GHA48820.1 hypothetical protein GCM10010303_70140 [Streptomyces purpurascens]
MRFLKAELLVALSTCSSEAVLPQLVRKLETLGVGRPVVGIVIPSGFSFDLDDSAVYLTMTSLFLGQAMGIDLSWPTASRHGRRHDAHQQGHRRHRGRRVHRAATPSPPS